MFKMCSHQVERLKERHYMEEGFETIDECMI